MKALWPGRRERIPVLVTRVSETARWLTPVGREPCVQFPWTRVPDSGGPPAFSSVKLSAVSVGRKMEYRLAAAGVVDWYGEGLVWGRLRRNQTVRVCWNVDCLVYKRGRRALYQAQPWLLGLRADGAAVGLIFETTRRLEIRIEDEVRVKLPGVGCRILVLEGESPLDVVRQLADWTGTAQMPPLWALGYHQCRWSYESQEEALAVAREFRSRQIPCDAIWMDIHYMRGYRVFTFSPEGYLEPAALTTQLHELGFRAVWIVDPGVKVDRNYAVYRDGEEQGCWIQRRGKPVHGRVWPGICVFPDFSAAWIRDWWAGWLAETVAPVADGIWCDMNEPALMALKSTLPEDAVHTPEREDMPQDHGAWHNIYGHRMCQAAVAGLAMAHPTRRPFLLTRAAFLGTQRLAAVWGGDNRASRKYLKLAVVQSLSLSLSGQPFSGHDAGGFEGPCTPEHFVDWFGVCSLLPFFRGHQGCHAPRREPWQLGEWAEQRVRAAIRRRYRLLPYLYTLFRQAATDGTPVVWPVFCADPADQSLRQEDRAFMLGSDLLVVPQCLDDGDGFCLPGNDWVPITLLQDDPEEALPRLLLRRGRLLPLGPVIENTGSAVVTELELVIAPDANATANGSLYEDDGDGFAYQNGAYRLTHLTVTTDGTPHLEPAVVDGEWGWPPDRQVSLHVVGGMTSRSKAPAT